MGMKKPGNLIARIRIQNSLSSSIEWTVRNLDLFAPKDASIPSQMKAATELAMFYGYTKLWMPHKLQQKLGPIRHFLVTLFDDPALSQWMRRLPCHYTHYATGYLALRAAGERLACFEEALCFTRRSGYPNAIEKLPYREMASQYDLWKAGLRIKPPSFRKFFRATSVGRICNPIYVSTPEVYSITHTLLYASDIAGPCTQLSAEEHCRTVDLVETLLVHFWRKADWDITGELLLNLVALNRWTTKLFNAAFRALLKAQGEDGTVPGPYVLPKRNSRPSRQQIFDGCYHTTLVAMFLYSAYLYRT
jgi:hypothetical protein